MWALQLRAGLPGSLYGLLVLVGCQDGMAALAAAAGRKDGDGMTVRIGHASKDEHNAATGGTAGDQTGKEICIRNWYRGDWKMLLRAKNAAVRKKIAANCRAACGNEKLGYDQSGRNTGLRAAQKAGWDLGAIGSAAEFDCSSLATACIQAAGVQIWNGGNAPTTRTMERVLRGTDAFEILKDSKYLIGTAHLLEGDILLNPGRHVVIVVDDGKLAGVSETVCKNEIASALTYPVMLPLVKRYDKGIIVKVIQQLLMLHQCDPAGVDGAFGKNTDAAVKKLQRRAGIEVDGKVGGDTWAVLLGKG